MLLDGPLIDFFEIMTSTLEALNVRGHLLVQTNWQCTSLLDLTQHLYHWVENRRSNYNGKLSMDLLAIQLGTVLNNRKID